MKDYSSIPAEFYGHYERISSLMRAALLASPLDWDKWKELHDVRERLLAEAAAAGVIVPIDDAGTSGPGLCGPS
jgi:hypothetical protein